MVLPIKWEDRIDPDRQVMLCTMNCSGVGMHAINPQTFNPNPCDDCESYTIRGCPIKARDEELAELRALVKKLLNY